MTDARRAAFEMLAMTPIGSCFFERRGCPDPASRDVQLRAPDVVVPFCQAHWMRFHEYLHDTGGDDDHQHSSENEHSPRGR